MQSVFLLIAASLLLVQCGAVSLPSRHIYTGSPAIFTLPVDSETEASSFECRLNGPRNTKWALSGKFTAVSNSVICEFPRLQKEGVYSLDLIESATNRTYSFPPILVTDLVPFVFEEGSTLYEGFGTSVSIAPKVKEWLGAECPLWISPYLHITGGGSVVKRVPLTCTPGNVSLKEPLALETAVFYFLDMSPEAVEAAECTSFPCKLLVQYSLFPNSQISTVGEMALYPPMSVELSTVKKVEQIEDLEFCLHTDPRAKDGTQTGLNRYYLRTEPEVNVTFTSHTILCFTLPDNNTNISIAINDRTFWSASFEKLKLLAGGGKDESENGVLVVILIAFSVVVCVLIGAGAAACAIRAKKAKKANAERKVFPQPQGEIVGVGEIGQDAGSQDQQGDEDVLAAAPGPIYADKHESESEDD